VTITFAWVLRQYFDLDVGSLLVFPGRDSNCQVGKESVGIHCFGDFSAIRFESLLNRPSGAETVYPISSRLVRIPFYFVEQITNYRTSLIVFLVLAIAASLFPFIHVVRKCPGAFNAASAVLIGLTNIGTIATLDRGNIIVFCVPFVYLYLVNIRTQSWCTALFWLCLAVSIKPQLLFLVVLLLWSNRLKEFLIALFVGIALLIGPYLIVGRGSLEVFKEWLRELSRWSGSLDPTETYPANITFNKIPSLIAVNGTYFGYLVILLFAGIVSWRILVRKRRLTAKVVASTVLIAALSGPITYIYYAILALPAIAILILSDSSVEVESPSKVKLDVLSGFLYALILTPMAIPSKIWFGASVGSDGIYNLWPIVIPTCALGLAILAFFEHGTNHYV
jgi:hypothetical protein